MVHIGGWFVLQLHKVSFQIQLLIFSDSWQPFALNFRFLNVNSLVLAFVLALVSIKATGNKQPSLQQWYINKDVHMNPNVGQKD